MDFTLSDDQRAFAETAASVFADYCSDEALRAFEHSGAPFMQPLWTQCVATGLHSIVVGADEGGLGLGMTELMGVLEAQGRALAPVPLWGQQLGLAALARFGTPALRELVVGPALAGDALLAVTLHTPLRATRAASGWRLDGRVPAVPLGGQAAWLLAAVEVQGATRLALIDPVRAGVRRDEGLSQHHLAVADVVFDGVTLGAEQLLAPPAMAWLEPRAIASLAALQLGVTAQQLARTVEYVSSRRQFERPIGSFQLVAGEMADGHIALETLRSSLWQLVYRLDAGLGALPQALATRVLACDTGHRVGHMAQHVHGGIGVDLSYPIHRYLYWSRALGTALGGADQHLARLGDWLADHDTLGWKYDLAEHDSDHAPV